MKPILGDFDLDPYPNIPWKNDATGVNFLVFSKGKPLLNSESGSRCEHLGYHMAVCQNQ